jgi:hypothetical protein
MAGIPSYFSASASSFPRRRICQIGKSGLRLRFQPLDEEAFLLFAIRLNDTPSIAARLRTAASPRFSCSPIMAAVLPASANVRSRCPSSGVHGGVGRRIVILILLSARARRASPIPVSPPVAEIHMCWCRLSTDGKGSRPLRPGPFSWDDPLILNAGVANEAVRTEYSRRTAQIAAPLSPSR